MYRLKLKQKHQLNALYAQIDSPITSLTIKGKTTKEPVPFDQRERENLKSFQIGDSWGELFDCAWFNLQGRIPENKLKKNLFLKLDFNCELCLFDENGLPVKGFTNKSSGFDRKLGAATKRYFQLNEFVSSDGIVNVWIEAGLNDLFGRVQKGGKMECAEIVERNLELRRLYYDLETLLPIYPKEAGRALNLALKNGQIEQSLAITAQLLQKNTSNPHIISAIGHSHIDLAWLWPIRETKRKAARTFSNALYLMKYYPKFKFGASQAQLYQWVKEEYPKLYEQIKERVKEGRWEVQGGMWVESDTNIPSGESLVRQMLYGIRFFQQEFGIRVKSLWLPDVFGYSGGLPQIIKKSGLDYFMTIKLSWNRNNKFPYHTFQWKGVDGTAVLAHMPPEGTYNSPITPEYAYKSQENYREKRISNRTLNLFGIGDGGGGPGTEHQERLERIANLDPLPQVRQEFSHTFFEDIAKDREKYPSYQGELYLEYHRGTYTSQSQNKYFNRKLEQKLKTIETMLVHGKKHAHYKSALETIWKEILLYQFHDILPGSSIKRVYDESVAAYKQIDQKLNKIIEEALGTTLITMPNSNNCTIYNPLPQQVRTWRRIDETFLEFTTMPFSDYTQNLQIYQAESRAESNIIENSLLRITLHSNGNIASIYDKELKQEILRSPGNVLKIYPDTGNAWNMSSHYWWLKANKPKLVQSKYIRYGEIQCVEQHYQYHNSQIKQRIFLHPETKLIEFDTELDWHDSRKMLRTAFPLKLKTDHAIFDIAFGNIRRSTLENNRIEKAKWEVSGHKWADLSDGKHGTAMITDCKYGYRIKNNIIDLNLLRATVNPGKEGDIGKHQFRYAFFVHTGDHIQGRVDWQATVFNTWFPCYAKSQLTNQLISISAPNIQYSTIKTAEEGNAIIIRLFESFGTPTSCSIHLHEFGRCEIKETNNVEEYETLIGSGPEIKLDFAPFEIRTLRIERN